METVITTVITGATTLLICLLNNYFQHNATKKLIEYKIDELTKKVEKHNQVIERVYRLEQKGAIYDEKISVINHRIKDLEN